MGGSGGTAFLKVVLQNFDVLAGPVVSLVYPLYASIKAIESKSPIDDQQWLTYWIIYSLITLFEMTFAKVIEWRGEQSIIPNLKCRMVSQLLSDPHYSLMLVRIPIWSYAKLIATCWLVIPYFSGAAYVYDHFVRPTFVTAQNSNVNIWYVPRKKDNSSKKDDIITAAEKYIRENGTDAFRDIIDKAEHRGVNRNGYGIFEDEHRY